MADLNPRVLRGQLGTWTGKKVTIGTTDNHYISGTIQAVEGATVHVSVKGRLILVPAEKVHSIREAPAVQAEYMK